MMENVNQRSFVILLIFFVIVILLCQMSSSNTISLKNDISPIDNEQLSLNDPIYINGNENFTLENGVLSGDGTLHNPFIIEGWDIQANMTNDGIRVENTYKYFIIRNCFIHYIDGAVAMHQNSPGKSPYFVNEEEKPYPIGIFLNNVSNGVVSNCEITGNVHAICLNNSNSIVVCNCKLYKNMCGIGVKLNSYNNIVCNCSSRNYGCGVCLYQNASSNIVDNCTSSVMRSIFAPRTIWTGYHISNSKDNLVVNCNCYSSGSIFLRFKDRGFIVSKASDNKIINFLSHGMPRGLFIEDSSNNSVSDSKMYNNLIGFYVDLKCRDNVFENNVFIKNKINAFDFSDENYWDDNYWDDWIGLKIKKCHDKAYNVPGRLLYNFDLNPKLFPQ